MIKISASMVFLLLVNQDFVECHIVNKTNAGNTRIYGGVEASEGQIPYQVYISKNNLCTSGICGGVILNENNILTAAHCVLGIDVKTVCVGGTLLNNMRRYMINNTIVHENYTNSRLDYDIAIIKLLEPLQFDSYIKPIGLIEKVPEDNTQCQVSGWGSTGVGVIRTMKLLYVNVHITNHQDCQKKIPETNLTNNMICAYEEYKDACTGDSGGPLVCNGQLTGLVSFGKQCHLSFPGVYSSIPAYMEWIQKNSASTTLIFNAVFCVLSTFSILFL